MNFRFHFDFYQDFPFLLLYCLQDPYRNEVKNVNGNRNSENDDTNNNYHNNNDNKNNNDQTGFHDFDNHDFKNKSAKVKKRVTHDLHFCTDLADNKVKEKENLDKNQNENESSIENETKVHNGNIYDKKHDRNRRLSFVQKCKSCVTRFLTLPDLFL